MSWEPYDYTIRSEAEARNWVEVMEKATDEESRVRCQGLAGGGEIKHAILELAPPEKCEDCGK